MSDPVVDAYHALCGYTLAHDSATFVHQHVVDAFGAQHAAAGDPPIRLAFSLVGLYLHVERGCTGRAVQRVHARLAQRTKTFPAFPLPSSRGSHSAIDVMAAAPGAERDAAIDAWCASVWSAFAESRPAVIALLDAYGIR